MICEMQTRGFQEKKRKKRLKMAREKNIKLGASPGDYRSKVRKGWIKSRRGKKGGPSSLEYSPVVFDLLFAKSIRALPVPAWELYLKIEREEQDIQIQRGQVELQMKESDHRINPRLARHVTSSRSPSLIGEEVVVDGSCRLPGH